MTIDIQDMLPCQDVNFLRMMHDWRLSFTFSPQEDIVEVVVAPFLNFVGGSSKCLGLIRGGHILSTIVRNLLCFPLRLPIRRRVV